jgi:hypothetical protein
MGQRVEVDGKRDEGARPAIHDGGVGPAGLVSVSGVPVAPFAVLLPTLRDEMAVLLPYRSLRLEPILVESPEHVVNEEFRESLGEGLEVEGASHGPDALSLKLGLYVRQVVALRLESCFLSLDGVEQGGVHVVRNDIVVG